jgi:hypothetical protein
MKDSTNELECQVWDYEPKTVPSGADLYADGPLYPGKSWPIEPYRIVYPPRGWICPVCGRGKSPLVLECPCLETGTSGGTCLDAVAGGGT